MYILYIHNNVKISRYLAIWTTDHLVLWPSRHLTIWTLDHLVIWTFNHLYIWPSIHLTIHTSDHPYIWPSRHLTNRTSDQFGPLIIWTSGLLTIWTSDHLNIRPSWHLAIQTSGHLSQCLVNGLFVIFGLSWRPQFKFFLTNLNFPPKQKYLFSKNYCSFQLLLRDCRPITYFEQIFVEIWSK